MKSLFVKYDNPTVRAKAPLRKAFTGDAGFDLFNASEETITIAPLKQVDIPAGLSVKIPDGYCGLLHPRSSTFRKRNLLVIPSLIDAGYTGPMFTLVWHPNLNGMDRPVLVEPWERLGQLIIVPIPQLKVIEVPQLPKTERGGKGFGSTGK